MIGVTRFLYYREIFYYSLFAIRRFHCTCILTYIDTYFMSADDKTLEQALIRTTEIFGILHKSHLNELASKVASDKQNIKFQ